MRRLLFIVLATIHVLVNAQEYSLIPKVISYSSSNNILVQGLNTGSIIGYSLDNGEFLFEEKVSTNALQYIDMNKSGDTILIIDCGLQTFLVTVHNQSSQKIFDGNTKTIFAPGGQSIIGLQKDSTEKITFYHTQTYKKESVWNIHDEFQIDSLTCKIVNVFKCGENIALQLQYTVPGLEQDRYPFIEGYSPYSFKQTAWDSLMIFSYPDMQLINKLGLQVPCCQIKELRYVQSSAGNLVFVRYAKGAQVLTEKKGKVIFSHEEADLSTIDNTGSTISYVTYSPFAIEEDGVWLNCIVNYDLKTQTQFAYNRLQTVPIDEWEEDYDYFSREQEADFFDRYNCLVYNQKNELFYQQNNGNITISDVNLISPEFQNNKENQIQETEFKRENNLLAFLSENEINESDTSNFSVINIKTGKFIIKDKKYVCSGKQEIVLSAKDYDLDSDIHFQFQSNSINDSSKLLSLIDGKPKPEHFYFNSYQFDRYDSLLVFDEFDGIVKMDLSNLTYNQFGYPHVLEWYGYNGVVSINSGYAALYFTDTGKILSIEKCGRILLWNIRFLKK